MQRSFAALAVIAVVTAACGGGHGSTRTSTTSTDSTTSDSALILTMYDNINQAFQRNPDDGVRAIIATQYPDDRADVDFARCINAFLPGATTLPRSKRFHFVPNIATMTLDPGYTVSSDRVKGLHPKGRIYVTDVTITNGGRPIVRPRHQVILGGKAYQFSAC